MYSLTLGFWEKWHFYALFIYNYNTDYNLHRAKSLFQIRLFYM